MAADRPRSRQRNVTGAGKSIQRRGSGLGTGPVGSTGGYNGRPGGGSKRPNSGSSFGSGHRSSGGGGFLKIIIILLVVFLGGGSVFTGDSYEDTFYEPIEESTVEQSTTGQSTADFLQQFYGYGNLSGGNVSEGWNNGSNVGTLDTSVAAGAREKYTDILGNGNDKTTLMIYLCGTDLESRSKMATSDLQEMIDATISEEMNVLVYSGGCKQWQNRAVSSRTNQIWQIKDDGMVCLEENLGSYSMTDADTLSFFIRWCAKNFPANRNSLIFWDHGGGSVSGFGYDEKFASTGSMSLGEIDKALTDGGLKFDFVGFDACLMATAENALMLSKHADYMIASEETEPGIGWYYTDWLSEYAKDSSMSTLEIGKNIIDDFVDTCARRCSGQSTTLSIVDLAELEATIPEALAAFSTDTYELIKNEEYAKVSHARSGAREFGVSSKIDQVDLVHLAENMDTEEGEALAEAVLGSVKYNRTSSNMTNSHGLSIYFPLRKTSMVNDAVETYEQIGLNDEYSRCIEAFASMEVSGQTLSGGYSSPMPSLLEILENYGSLSGYNENKEMNISEAESEYVASHFFDTNVLQWMENGNSDVISIPEEQWDMVLTLYANMFYDDGAGYIDLGLDNVYEFDTEGNLLAPAEATWLAINGQPVAYYHEATVDDGISYSIIGRVPVLYNGERGELVLEFTDENPYGSVVGVRRVYIEGETQTMAKTMDTVTDGDVIDFVCDYYSYEGEYIDSYMFGEQIVVDGELEISDVYVDETHANLTYLFTDIYHQKYWTNPVKF